MHGCCTWVCAFHTWTCVFLNLYWVYSEWICVCVWGGVWYKSGMGGGPRLQSQLQSQAQLGRLSISCCDGMRPDLSLREKVSVVFAVPDSRHPLKREDEGEIQLHWYFFPPFFFFCTKTWQSLNPIFLPDRIYLMTYLSNIFKDMGGIKALGSESDWACPKDIKHSSSVASLPTKKKRRGSIPMQHPWEGESPVKNTHTHTLTHRLQ